jgi:hypothetical protein
LYNSFVRGEISGDLFIMGDKRLNPEEKAFKV